jgi:hypothetical protein
MCPNNTGGHKRKFSMIKAAHAKLGHDKENPKDPKDLSFS